MDRWICTECGWKNDPSALFCGGCGKGRARRKRGWAGIRLKAVSAGCGAIIGFSAVVGLCAGVGIVATGGGIEKMYTTGCAIFILIITLVSCFLGGWVAGRMAPESGPANAVAVGVLLGASGLVLWALMTAQGENLAMTPVSCLGTLVIIGLMALGGLLGAQGAA